MKKTRVEEILMNIICKAANVTSFTGRDFLKKILKFDILKFIIFAIQLILQSKICHFLAIYREI
jgi:hypothetical protein